MLRWKNVWSNSAKCGEMELRYYMSCHRINFNTLKKKRPLKNGRNVYEPAHVSHDHLVYKLLNRGPQILLNLCGSFRANVSMNFSASRFARKCSFEF